MPTELGNLSELERMRISGHVLEAIPAELANLKNLHTLDLSYNELTELPRELAGLPSLRTLDLSHNLLTELPPTLAGFTHLTSLKLRGNRLRAPVLPEIAKLHGLTNLDLHDNNLSGPIPGEMGSLTSLQELILSRNGSLTGPVPPEFGRLNALNVLHLSDTSLFGRLPLALTELRALRDFRYTKGTRLCAPETQEFQEWMMGLASPPGRRCTSNAYVVQAVQSVVDSVPLVAGRGGLLRVLLTAVANPEGAILPPVQVRAYVNGTEHTRRIGAGKQPIPEIPTEHDLAASSNLWLPGDWVQPGLELVIEVDPDSTLDASLGVVRRIPAEGRHSVDVREMPPFELTVIPFLFPNDPDSTLVRRVEYKGIYSFARDVLPVSRARITVHAPVETSTRDAHQLMNETRAVRALEGGDGHYLGASKQFERHIKGLAELGGRISVVEFSRPGLGSREVPSTVAHELGHNFGLEHAPCGVSQYVDPNFPDPLGRIGAWGYNPDRGRLISSNTFDLMGYCSNRWISPYHFKKALEYRIAAEARAAYATRHPVRSVLLWGSTDSTRTPTLEPVFVVDAPPSLPDRSGEWTVEGRDADGVPLFSLDFAMQPVADAGPGAGGFAFVLPVRPGWEALAAVTLSGPGGTTILDASTNIPMAISRDRRTGDVTAILRGDDSVAGDAETLQAGRELDVWISRGIPGADAWRP